LLPKSFCPNPLASFPQGKRGRLYLPDAIGTDPRQATAFSAPSLLVEQGTHKDDIALHLHVVHGDGTLRRSIQDSPGADVE